MKYARNISFFLVLMFLLSLLCAPALAVEAGSEIQTNTAIESGCHTLDAATSYFGPKTITENIKTALVYEMNSDTLMYALNADEKIYPSSLVKILTALIAVEKGNVETEIVVTQEVLDTVPEYAIIVDIVADEKMTLADLLHCMMVGSGNDAAAIIATHISGSQEAFVQEMNAYAKKMGCTATQFTNVHGLHDENQYSTTRDMAKILASAVQNEAFMTYFSAVHYTVPATNKSEQRDLSSGNFLMNKDAVEIYFDERVKGGRTGIADDGLRCLASVASNDNMELICIITGSESNFTEEGYTLTYGGFLETIALYDAAFNGYKVAQILYADQILEQCKISNGVNDVVLGSRTALYTVLPVDATINDIAYRYKNNTQQFEAPIESGQILTSVELWYGNLCVGQTDLVAMNSVQAVITQPVDESGALNRGTVVTIVVLSVIVGVAVLMFIWVKFSGKLKRFFAKKQKTVRRTTRRRSR